MKLSSKYDFAREKEKLKQELMMMQGKGQNRKDIKFRKVSENETVKVDAPKLYLDQRIKSKVS